MRQVYWRYRQQRQGQGFAEEEPLKAASLAAVIVWTSQEAFKAYVN